MTAPTDALIERLKGLLAKATDGPWEADSNAYGCNFVYGCGRQALVCGGNNHDTLTVEDAALIAAMHEALPTLLARIEAAEKVIEPFRIAIIKAPADATDNDFAAVRFRDLRAAAQWQAGLNVPVSDTGERG